MRPAAFIIALAICAQPVLAGETAWQEVAPGVSVRLVSAGTVDGEGNTLVGLEIDMPESTKTYWRVPGETGIPTQIDISRSHGIAGHRVRWPYPTIDTQSGYLDYAYFGPTVLPVELRLEEASATLELSATLGVCAEICVPVKARFEMPLGGESPDRVNGLRLRQALATAPVAWKDAASPIGAVRYDAADNAVVVAVAEGIDPTSLIGALPAGLPLLGAPQPDPAGGVVRLPLIGNDGQAATAALAEQPIDLVFQTEDGPFVLTRRIGR